MFRTPRTAMVDYRTPSARRVWGWASSGRSTPSSPSSWWSPWPSSEYSGLTLWSSFQVGRIVEALQNSIQIRIIFSCKLLALHSGHRHPVCLPHHSRLLRRYPDTEIFSEENYLFIIAGVRRKTPHNFIFLGLFTLAEGFMLGTITARYNIDEVQYQHQSYFMRSWSQISIERPCDRLLHSRKGS